MPDVWQLEENIVTFEDFLKVTVTELSDQVDLVEVIEVLTLWDAHFKHMNDIGMSTVFQKHDLSKDAPRLWE